MATELDYKNAAANVRSRKQKVGESDMDYLKAARKYAADTFHHLYNFGDHFFWGDAFQYCHVSHAVAEALRLTQARFSDLDVYGVEGSVEQDIMYLNVGFTYEPTITYRDERFRVESWGDAIEFLEQELGMIEQ